MRYLSKEKRAEFREFREAADSHITLIAENSIEINENMAVIRTWKPGSYAKGDVRVYEGNPYKCEQAHDSTGNETWNPADAHSLWIQYHGTSPDTARNWIAPTGAHDMYHKGEWMIWTDGIIYECIEDTVYDPTTYGQAWKKHEPNT